SGVVPFRAMLRHWEAAGRPVPVRLLLSAQSLHDVIYREELLGFAGETADVRIALTREWPEDWRGHRGRIDGDVLAAAAWPPEPEPRVYVCGPSGFVETVASALVDNGQPPSSIRTERFGPTGR